MADTYTYGSRFICVLRGDADYERIAETIPGDTPEWDKHAGFLIKAANSYEALVEALQRIVKRSTPDVEDMDDDRKRDLYHILAIAEAALSTAESGK